MSPSERFPALHRPDRWEWAAITMTFTTQIPDEALVASTHVIAFVNESVLLCRDDREGIWFLPGGTREPEESVREALSRELLEEAGARLLSEFHPIGAHVGRTDAPRPYRRHLPHPDQAWLWGWADVEVIGPPANPYDGEAIAEVKAFPVLVAVRRAASDTTWAGELILLAAERRASTKARGENWPPPERSAYDYRVVVATILPTTPAQHLEPSQPAARGTAHRRGTHDPRRPGRCRPRPAHRLVGLERRPRR